MRAAASARCSGRRPACSATTETASAAASGSTGYSRWNQAAASAPSAASRASRPRSAPTSCATAKGTGISSPIHDGTAPVGSRTGATRMLRSSDTSTTRQVWPRKMNEAPGST